MLLENTMHRLLIALSVLLLAGCEGGNVVEPTTPTDLFTSESKPIGDPSIDPYRPPPAKPFVEIYTEPKPPPAKK